MKGGLWDCFPCLRRGVTQVGRRRPFTRVGKAGVFPRVRCGRDVRRRLFPCGYGLFETYFKAGSHVVCSELGALPVVMVHFGGRAFQFAVGGARIMTVEVDLIVLFPLFGELILCVVKCVVM